MKNIENTIQGISPLCFLNDSYCNIIGKYLIIQFTLNYLAKLNDIISKEYNIPKITMEEFQNSEKSKEIKKRLDELKDEPIFTWLSNECLENLKNVVVNVKINNIEDLKKLIHIIKLCEIELERIDNFVSIEKYDILYRYIDRLTDHGFIDSLE